jgi:polynucleotide 5'-hydroxyl-kinase GRC3/NOL9
MKQTIEKEKTLLVDGPARVDLLSGRGSVLGALLKTGENIVVRKGKRIPFWALRNSEVELVLGDSASYAETDGNSVPSSWREAADEILSTKEPKLVLVFGGTDSGKSSFCTFLANLSLNNRFKVALIDGDLGQSDLGPPGTISLGLVEEPIIDLFKLRPEDLVFIGVTSPDNEADAILNALRTLKEEALKDVNLLIVNTDSWVDGDSAVSYKLSLVETVAPNFVVAIQAEDELAPILSSLRDVNVLVIDSPQNVKKRDQETRKLLRESAYRKYLKKSKVRSFPLSWIKIEGDLRIKAWKRSRSKIRIEERREETSDAGETDLKEGEHRKLAAGFSGMGTIYNIDRERDSIRISTPVDEDASKIRLGQIKLDGEGNEIGLILGGI